MVDQMTMFDPRVNAVRPNVGDLVTVGEPTKILLRDYQRDALKEIAKAESAGTRKQMVVLPTGAGKTIVFASLIAERQKRALILAHRDELIDQAVKKVRSVIPGCAVGVVQAEQDDYWAPVVVASVQTLARENRLQPVSRQGFGLVIVDEAHHSAAKTYRQILDATHAGEDDGPLLVGVTATPDRGDGKGLDDIYERIVYTKSLIELIGEGYLSDITAIRVQIEELDLNGVPKAHGDYKENALEEALINADQPHMTAIAVAENAKDRQTIVFTASVRLAEETRDELLSLNIPAEMVSGKTPRDERRAILKRFQMGLTRVICNCMVLTEGFDCPEISCVVVARPTASRALYQQMVGRGLRVIPGKTDCMIIDVVGVTEDHALQTSATLVGRDFASKGGAGQRIPVETSLLIEIQEQLFTDPITGRLVTMPVKDLFGRSRFNWRRSDEFGSWQMPLDADRSLAILAGSTGWDVIAVHPKAKRVEVIQTCLDGSIVQGYAEEFARKNGASFLLDKNAPWRFKDFDPESKQADMARWNGIDLDALRNEHGRILKGAVSDAIDAALVSKQLRNFANARRRAA